MEILEIASKEVGVQEVPKGSNWGKDVQKYLMSVGINFPASWCMAFVYWCFNQSDSTKGKLVRTGGVLKQWKATTASYRKKEPLPGDIFIQDHGGGLGHTGIVEKVEGTLIHTIEGNTNDTGSREGYEVCRKVRPISSCIGFIRITCIAFIVVMLTSCSANWHLRRAQYHERMAYALGAEVKHDTVFKNIEVITPVHRIDTVVNNVNFLDTVYVNSDHIITKVKVNEVEKKVYVHSECLPDTIKIKEPIYINKTLKTEATSIIKWWWLLVAIGIGFLIPSIIKLIKII